VRFYRQRCAALESRSGSSRSAVDSFAGDSEAAPQLVASHSVSPLTSTPLQQPGDLAKQFQIVVGQGEDESRQLIRQRAGLAAALLSGCGGECLWFHTECVCQAAYEFQRGVRRVASFQAEHIGIGDLCLVGKILGADAARKAELAQERTETSGTGHGAARVADLDRLLFSVMRVTIVTLGAAGTGDGAVAEELGAGLSEVRRAFLRARAIGAGTSTGRRDSLAAQATALATWCERAVGAVDDLDSTVAQTLHWISVGALALASYWRTGDRGKPRIFLALLARAMAEQDAETLNGRDPRSVAASASRLHPRNGLRREVHES